jgi:hypothetical protein
VLMLASTPLGPQHNLRPPTGARLRPNYNHPMCQSLRFLCAPNAPGKPINLANGSVGSVVRGSIIHSARVYQSLQDPHLTFPMADTGLATGMTTLFGVGYTTVGTTTGQSLIAVNDSATQILSLLLSSATSHQMCLADLSTVWVGSGASPVNSNWYAMAAVTRGPTDQALAIRNLTTNVVTFFTNSVSRSIPSSGSNILFGCNGVSSAADVTGSLALAGYSKANVTNEQLVGWVLDPFSVLVGPSEAWMLRPHGTSAADMSRREGRLGIGVQTRKHFMVSPKSFDIFPAPVVIPSFQPFGRAFHPGPGTANVARFFQTPKGSIFPSGILNFLNLTAALSFAGAVAKVTQRALAAAALSSSGTMVKQTARALTGAGLGFAGSLAKMAGKATAGALSFAGAQSKSIGHGLTAALSFAGSVQRAIATARTAALSFSGAAAKTTGRQLVAASLSFSGAFNKARLLVLTAALSFAGAVSRSTAVPLTGGLSFSGAVARLVSRSLTAALSFAGAVAKLTQRALTSASLGFTGAIGISKTFLRSLTAALSFSGASSRSIGKVTAGALSFAGAQGKATTRGLTAALSFAGAFTKLTQRALAAASLGFTGAIGISKTFLRSLTAALSFTGGIQRQTQKPLGGGLSFAGAMARLVGVPIAAALSFAGTLARRSSRAVAAALSFAGSVQRQTRKQLAATLTLTGDVLASFVHGVLGIIRAYNAAILGAFGYSAHISSTTPTDGVAAGPSVSGAAAVGPAGSSAHISSTTPADGAAKGPAGSGPGVTGPGASSAHISSTTPTDGAAKGPAGSGPGVTGAAGSNPTDGGSHGEGGGLA